MNLQDAAEQVHRKYCFLHTKSQNID